MVSLSMEPYNLDLLVLEPTSRRQGESMLVVALTLIAES
jgi:hypothetical protein